MKLTTLLALVAILPLVAPAQEKEEGIKAMSMAQLFEDGVRHEGHVVVAGRITSVEIKRRDADDALVNVIIQIEDKGHSLRFFSSAGDKQLELMGKLKEGQLVAVEGQPLLQSGGMVSSMIKDPKVFTNGFYVAKWKPSDVPAKVLPDILPMKQYFDEGIKLGSKTVKLSGPMSEKFLADDGYIRLVFDDGSGRTISVNSQSATGNKENWKLLQSIEVGQTVVARGRFVSEGPLYWFEFDKVFAEKSESGK